jgi:ABC-type transport system involved in cytochrome c biogenesis permease subunit
VKKLTPRQAVLCGLATAASYLLLGPALFITGTILLDLRLVTAGIVAWSGLFALLFLGIGAIGFLIAIPSLYARDLRKGRFRRTFFIVLSIQLFAYPVLHSLSKIEHLATVIVPIDVMVIGGGLVLGALFAFLAARSPAHQPGHAPAGADR